MSRRLTLVLLAAAVPAVSACSSGQPTPGRASSPSELTVRAERGQTRVRQARDRAQCEMSANRRATSSASWVSGFSKCMDERGYAVH